MQSVIHGLSLKLCRILIISMCMSSTIAHGQKSILFVGNSLTYYNDMPQILQKMFEEQKHKIKVEQSTYTGINLSEHVREVMASNGSGSM